MESSPLAPAAPAAPVAPADPAGPTLAASRRSRPARRAVAVALVAALVGGLFGAAWVLTAVPLSQGSIGGGGQQFFERSVDDPFGSGTLYIYCAPPNSRITWHTSVRNDGPLPVTIDGADSGPIAVSVREQTNAFWLEEIASARVPEPANTPLAMHDMTDPATAPALRPTTIEPGDELELWARYRTGGLPGMSGGGILYRSIRLRFSILGVQQVADVPLRDGIEVQGPPCASPPG